MTDTFENVWETPSALYSIPKNVVDEINILSGASTSFINLVAQLETESDLNMRATIAKQYIDDNAGLKEISYDQLGKYLASYDAAELDIWRKLYVLERSIPPRFGDKYTWPQRLKMFYNTYVRESAVAGKATYKGKKIYLIKGNKDTPTNHDKLVYGHGKWGADFYFYDDTLPGDKTWQKMVKVEMKHGSESVETEVAKHASDKFLYGAKYLILAMADGSYYMINYNVNPAEVTKLAITCQDVYKL